MTEQQTEQKPAEEVKSEGQNLASIEPKKIIVDAEEVAPKTNENKVAIEPNERSLLAAVRVILREHGVRKSMAAIRDAVEMPHEVFAPKQAVSALSALGFKASFGSLSVTNLNAEFFPAIAFLKSGEAVVLKEATDEDEILVVYPQDRNRSAVMSLAEFKADFSGYVILAKELNQREKEERSGHWFFSAFRKSKWLYVQVMIAAMVSNFLSLTTSLFTMTVYDRIIPNGAFESLIALSIGVVIALGFDFLIKSLRAKFIDTASKRADLEISRRLFDRILTLTPAEQRQKTGAMAGTIREFETLREFFNSSDIGDFDRPAFCIFLYLRHLSHCRTSCLRTSCSSASRDYRWTWNSAISCENYKRIS
jgi:ATP-binding cassette subfamily C protein LapB